MVRLSEIERFGQRLQNDLEIHSLTSTQLYAMLRKSTNSFTPTVLRGYVKILKELGFVEFQDDCRWHIIKVKK